jgi:translocation and assembly module TamB
MKRVRVIAALLAATLLVLAAAAGATAAWLLYTESGLAWLTARAARYVGEGLALEGTSGTLAGGAQVRLVRYAGEDLEITVREAGLRLSPRSLLRLSVRVTGLNATSVAVVTRPGEPAGVPPRTLELPLPLEVGDAYIEHLVIDFGTDPEPLEIHRVRLREYAGGGSDHRVEDVSATVLGHALALRGSIGAGSPFPIDAAAAVVRTVAPQGTLHARIGGNLLETDIEGAGASGTARFSATLRMRPYEPLPIVSLSARASGLDLQAFVPTLPRTDLRGELVVKRTGSGYEGPLTLFNALAGPYDRGRLPVSALRTVARSDLKVTDLAGLTLDLGPAGTLAGSGQVDIASRRAQASLTTQRLDLSGLHTQLRATSLSGSADIVASAERQSIMADLRESGIELALTAHRAGDDIEIPRFVARARGGEARGAAAIVLSGHQPFTIEADLSRFDPSAWGEFPAGLINATVDAKGALAGPEAEVRFSVRDSRLFDAPFVGQGTASLTRERLRHLDVDLTLGGNRVWAQGALGTPKDTLAVRFDARNPGLLEPALKGRLRGTAELRGAWQAPLVRFDVTASGLAHEEYGAIRALAARGTLTARTEGPLTLDAEMKGVTARGLELDAVTLKFDGTRSVHSGALSARGGYLDLRARARGGWDPQAGWSGTLEELVNRGEIPVELVAPVELTIGPQRAQAKAFAVKVMEGELTVSQLAYEQGRLATAGRFTDLPLKPVLALAGVPAEPAGSLRVAGRWSVTNAPTLAGSIEVSRQSGDLALEKFRLGLRALTVRADLGAAGVAFQANLEARLITAQARGRIGAVGNGAVPRITGESPLDFTAEVAVAQLAPFAAFVETPVLVRGEARATLQGKGTLGNPVVTGPITADRLALALPAEGIDLEDGTLRAHLTERDVRVDAFSIRGGSGVLTARGRLARTLTDEAALEWRAERFTALARPDRRLVVTGQGIAAAAAGKVLFKGKLATDEGLFEVAGADLPRLGDDVVVIRRSAPDSKTDAAALPERQAKPEPRALERAQIDLVIDLGEKVLVRAHGLEAWLAGNLRIYTDARGTLLAKGTVETRRGFFAAYGQRLDIERGRVFFDGPLTNPGLDVLAVRRRLAVEPGVQVTGTLDQPIVRIVSNPPLPEGEALSWLVLGRGADTARPGELSALPLVTGAIMGRAGKPLAQALQLDEVGLRAGATPAEQFLTVGRRITDRLYVVFEQGLGTAGSLLRLELTLTERLVARLEAGETSGVGLFYRRSWD